MTKEKKRPTANPNLQGGAFMNQILTLIILSFAFPLYAQQTLGSYELSPVEQKAQKIYEKLSAGVVPELKQGINYYTGRCVVLDGAVDPEVNVWIITALQGNGEAYKIASWITNTASKDPFQVNPYRTRPIEDIYKNYVPKHKGYIKENTLFFPILNFPPLHTTVSQNIEKDEIYVILQWRGTAYCVLTPLD